MVTGIVQGGMMSYLVRDLHVHYNFIAIGPQYVSITIVLGMAFLIAHMEMMSITGTLIFLIVLRNVSVLSLA